MVLSGIRSHFTNTKYSLKSGYGKARKLINHFNRVKKKQKYMPYIYVLKKTKSRELV